MHKPADLLGRDAEWAFLTERLAAARRGEPGLIVLTGARQVGKTWLTSRFAQAAGGARHQVRGLAEAEELEAIAASVRRPSGPFAVIGAAAPATLPALLEALAEASADSDVLLVLDEVPYLADTRPTWTRELQAIWDSSVAGRQRRLLIVLVGSALRVMEQFLVAGGPLYGRAERLHLEPFDVGEIAAARNLRAREVVECYACTGGLPRLTLAWRPGSVRANLSRLAFRPGAPMLPLADEMLHHDSLEGPSYRRILQAIASGDHRYSRIVRRVDLRIDESLDVLEGAGYIRRRLPVGAPPRARKGAEYRVTNPFFAFVWGPLERARQHADAGQTDVALEAASESVRQHVAAVYEGIARRHATILVARGDLPSSIVGEWWTHRGRGAQVDVLGLHEGRVRFVGEAKWSGSPVSALRQLTETLRRTPFLDDEPESLLWTTQSGEPTGARHFDLEVTIGDLREGRS